MDQGVRQAPPQVKTQLESFADVSILDEFGCRTIVQVISRVWVYEDSTWMMAVHNAINPAINHIEAGEDAAGADALLARATWLRSLAVNVLAATLSVACLF